MYSMTAIFFIAFAFQMWAGALRTRVWTVGFAMKFLSTLTVHALLFGPAKFVTEVSVFQK